MEILGDELDTIILYGSQARGDAVEGSNIDVLCVMKGPFDYGELLDLTSEVSAELSLKYDVVLSSAFVPRHDFESRNDPFLMNGHICRRRGVGWHDRYQALRERRLAEAVFVANLWAVVQCTAPEVYLDPEEFCRKTYPTTGLSTVLGRVAGALRRGVETGDRIISVQTAFGGARRTRIEQKIAKRAKISRGAFSSRKPRVRWRLQGGQSELRRQKRQTIGKFSLLFACFAFFC